MPKRKTTATEDTGPKKAAVVLMSRSSLTLSKDTTAKAMPKKTEIPPPADLGELLIYGNNEAGQLAFEDPSVVKRYPFLHPLDRVGGHPIRQVSSGGMHSAVLNNQGTVWTWGCNDEGALGTGKEDDDDTWKAKQVKLEDVVDVTTGDSHTAFLTKTSQVYLTGTMRDASGAFGLDRESGQVTSFVPFLFLSNRSRDPNVVKDRAVKISSGYNHFAYLNVDHEVHLLGDSGNGQLGPIPVYRESGGRFGRTYFLQRRKVHIKVSKTSQKMHHFSDVWCVPHGTFVRTKEEEHERWFACGNNMKNQLGFSPAEGQELGVQWDWEEVVTLRDKNVIKIVGTQTQTVALTKEGDLYVFGHKEYLGLSSELQDGCTDTPVLHPVCQNDGVKFRDVSCSSNNATVAVTKDGQLYVWGSPSSSVVCTEDDEMEAVMQPTKVQSKNTGLYEIFKVSAGASHALLVGKKKPEVNGTS